MDLHAPIDEWRFLEPWCEKLHGHLRLQCGLQYMKRTPSRAKHWELHVNFFPDKGSGSQRVEAGEKWSQHDASGVWELREAFDLLCLTSTIDNGAWRQLLGECIVVDRREGGMRVPDEHFPMPQIRFRLDERDASLYRLVDALTQFFAAQYTPSPAYHAARNEILVKASRMGVGVQPPYGCIVPVHFEFFPTNSTSDFAVSSALNRALQLIGALSESENEMPTTRLSSRFIVASQSVYAGAVPITQPLSRSLFKSMSNVHCANCALSLNADIPLPVKQLGSFFHELLVQDEASNGTLSLMFDTASLHHFCCSMSALASARGISTITLDGMFDGRAHSNTCQRLKWQWLSFALFSSASGNTSITKVILDDLRISPSDVDAIAAVLVNNQPEPRLIESGARSNEKQRIPDRYARLHKGSSFRVWPRSMETSLQHPPSFSNDKATMVAHDGNEKAWLQVLDSDVPNSEYTSLMIPGYGKCFVPQSSISSKKSQPPEGSWTSRRPVTSLSLSFVDNVDIQALRRLLELVGQHLEYLSISNIGPHRWHYDIRDTSDGADLSWIRLACPHLQQLRIADSSIQLDCLAGCSLRYLELFDCRVTESSALKFFNILGDPAASISKSLVELSLHVSIDNHQGLNQTVADRLTAALISNGRLQFLRVWLPRYLRNNLAPQLRAFDNQPLAIARERLPIASKLAFLSCVSSMSLPKALSNNNPSSQLAGNKETGAKQSSPRTVEMNEDVLRAVFAMAATCETRLVEVV